MGDVKHLLALPALLFAMPQGASAQSTGLDDMVGARAGQAEGEVQRRGYAFVRGEKGDDRSYTYWWNAARNQCVTIATMDGRYSSVTATPAPDCRQRGTAAAAIGDRPTVDGQSVALGLVCFGDGTRDGIASGTAWTWNARRNRYDQARTTETRTEMFDASLMIQTWDGGGRIRLPKSLIPPLNSRGNDGWWDLNDVTVGDDTIRASYRLNGLNKPKVTIDRRSGRITVKGLSDYGFRGTCDTIGHELRRF